MNGTPYDTLTVDATDDDICDAVLTYLVMLEPAPPFKIAVAIRAREVRCPIPVEWTTASYAGITTTSSPVARMFIKLALVQGLTVFRIFGKDHSESYSLLRIREALTWREKRDMMKDPYDDDEIPF